MSHGEMDDAVLRRLLKLGEPLLNPEGREDPRFVIRRELGRGAMGVVFEAEDRELHRRVAVKFLSGALAENSDARRRFQREAQAAARLRHPNIAAIFDADEHRIVMELIDGVPLSRSPRDDRRSLVELLRDAALGVHHAHERGVIHRDLKPSNLLVEGKRVVVTDFGLAKDIDLCSSLSLSGHVLGTPAYMAPEQAQGRQRDIDPRTDVYGLGATLYDLFCGRPPFVDSDPLQLLRRIQEDEPRSIRLDQPDFPADLETVIFKCLEKKRERRYASALDLADDLSRWLLGRPVVARPPSMGERTVRALRRRFSSLLALGVVAVVLTLSFFWGLERRERGAVEAALKLSDDIHDLLDDVERHLRSGDVESARKLREDGERRCRQFLDRHDVAHAHYLLGLLRTTLERTDEARSAFDRAIVMDPSLGEARIARGLLTAERYFQQSGRAGSAGGERTGTELEELRRSALEDLSASQFADMALIDKLYAEAQVQRLEGRKAAARDTLRALLSLDPVNLRGRRAQSQLELELGRAEDARHAAMSAVDLYRGFGPAYLAQLGRDPAAESSPPEAGGAALQHLLSDLGRRIAAGDAAAYSERASARLFIRDLEGALSDLSESLRLRPDNAHAHGNRGVVHTRHAARCMGENLWEQALVGWEDAITDYDRALLLDPHLIGARNNRGVCALERGSILRREGRLGEADQELQRAREDFEQAIEQNPRFMLARHNRGIVGRSQAETSFARGEIQEALSLVRASIADFEAALGLRSDDVETLIEVSVSRMLLAELHRVQGSQEEKDRELDEARAALWLATQLDPVSARAVGYLGIARVRANRTEDGLADLRRALLLGPDATMHRRIVEVLEAASH